jgi:penicillin-insensitive murein endopeptidase
LNIGHISGPSGGFLRPHRSHQSGRDVDLGYYYQDGGQWYLAANATSLDRGRTWALVRALITETDVHFIFIDHSIQGLLREYAEGLGEDPNWLDDVFRGRGAAGAALIRHAPGHRTHLHVRFYSPVAQETARRSHSAMVQLNLIDRPQHFAEHRVKKGETLIQIAQRYGTTVNAIKRANGLRSSKIIARKAYKIPRTGPASAGPRIRIPPRRLPPAPISLPKPNF